MNILVTNLSLNNCHVCHLKPLCNIFYSSTVRKNINKEIRVIKVMEIH